MLKHHFDIFIISITAYFHFQTKNRMFLPKIDLSQKVSNTTTERSPTHNIESTGIIVNLSSYLGFH